MQTQEAERSAEDKEQDETCPECGMTRRALYADGHMGCAHCYQSFGAEVERALTEIHGKSIHIGKVWEARRGG